MKKFSIINNVLQTIILGVILVLLLNISVKGRWLKSKDDVVQPSIRIVDVSTINNPIIGDINATVELIVFSDFECPYCYKLYQQIENIAADYIQSAQLKFIFINYPLKTHENANFLAKIAECAYENEIFEEVYRYLFENHAEINKSNYKELLVDFFPDTLSLEKYIEKPNLLIAEDMRIAGEIGVKGTPVFIVDNVFYLGAKSDEEFKEIIDKAITEKEKMCK